MKGQPNLKFYQYLRDKTKYDVDIFKSYFLRIDKVIVKGKITTDNEFYDASMMVDQLCHLKPIDHQKIQILNWLIADYEHRKSQKMKNRNS